jgi:cytochrome c
MTASNFRLRLVAGAILATGLASCGSEKAADTTTTTTTTADTGMTATAPADVSATTTATAPPPVAPAAAEMVDYASLTGDAVHGEKVFTVCKTCHVAEKGVNRIGPSLWGVVGRTAGSIPGYQYSAANKNSGIIWTQAKLFEYLAAPQKVVPGTKMAYAGLKPPQDRADLIAYLDTRK